MIKFLDIRIPYFTLKRITVSNIITDYNNKHIFSLSRKALWVLCKTVYLFIIIYLYTYLFLTKILKCKHRTISQSNMTDASVFKYVFSWNSVNIFLEMLNKMYVLIKQILRQYIIFPNAFSARCCKLEREVNLWPWFEIGKHLDCFWIHPPPGCALLLYFSPPKTTLPYCVYFTNRLDSRFYKLYL